MKKINSTNRVLQRFILIVTAIFLLSVTLTAIVKDEIHIGAVNKDLCVSCGNCWSIDPMDFLEDDDGTATVSNPVIYEQKFKEAQDACPVSAIWSNF